jgi:NAD(P)-dependent dehydrogenase (short-subunit alcohol dehydrogenase family)
MRKLGRGDIIIVSSINTLTLKANSAPYTMGKAAAEALALTVAKEERQYGIRANVVQPSLTVTEMGHKLVRATHGTGTDIHELDAQAPFGHVSVPEDVAGVVAFLVSPANSYGNGQRFAVDGGG